MSASPWNYLLWLLAFIWTPAALFWLGNLGQIRRHGKALLAFSFLAVALCDPVEYWIVREVLVLHRGHYLGLYFLGIPLEDHLFFFSFPAVVAPIALKLESLLGEGATC